MITKNRFNRGLETAAKNTAEGLREEGESNGIFGEKKPIPPDVLEKVLEGSRKGRGGNHTLYLSVEVGAALDDLAAASRKSKSSLVDEILRAVLIGR